MEPRAIKIKDKKKPQSTGVQEKKVVGPTEFPYIVSRVKFPRIFLTENDFCVRIGVGAGWQRAHGAWSDHQPILRVRRGIFH